MDFWQIILIILAIIMVVLYLIILPLARRGAMRKQADAVNQMHSDLKTGDRVILIDGIVGDVISAEKEELVIALQPSKVAVTVKRAGIAGVERQAVKESKHEPEVAKVH